MKMSFMRWKFENCCYVEKNLQEVLKFYFCQKPSYKKCKEKIPENNWLYTLAKWLTILVIFQWLHSP